MTYTRCRIDTINSPDDGHIAARNMYKIEVGVYEGLCIKLVYLQRLYWDIGQQHIKYLKNNT